MSFQGTMRQFAGATGPAYMTPEYIDVMMEIIADRLDGHKKRLAAVTLKATQIRKAADRLPIAAAEKLTAKLPALDSIARMLKQDAIPQAEEALDEWIAYSHGRQPKEPTASRMASADEMANMVPESDPFA